MARDLEKAGANVVILDPLQRRAVWPSRAIVFHQAPPFEKHLLSVTRRFVFIDESSAVLDPHDTALWWLGTMSGNWGHSVTFICQRLPQIPLNVRAQCNAALIFSCELSDAQALFNTFGQPALLTAPTLPNHTFFYAKRGRPLLRGDQLQDHLTFRPA